MKTIKLALLACLAVMNAHAGIQAAENLNAAETKHIIAYVTSRGTTMPDPAYMTHINYAFGHVNETFNGVIIENETKLHQIVGLKKQKPDLKVMLSIGGWGSGRFSEMAADPTNRQLFAADCQRVVQEFNLDGIDIDWEYPTSSAANISSSPEDTNNFTLLMQDIRKAIGKDKLLTLATVASARYIDFKAIDPYIDFVNIMAYDMGRAPKFNSPLYRSENAGRVTAEEAVDAHLAAGVPAGKLTLGMPFYGRGGEHFSDFMDYKEVINVEGYQKHWDDVAKVPYLTNAEGEIVFSYNDTRSLAIKCEYIHKRGLLGAMYWEYNCDNESGDLRRTVYEGMKKRTNSETPYQVLVLTERGGQHGGFTDAGLQWLAEEGKRLNFEITEINNTQPITEAYLDKFALIVQLDFVPYTWSETAQNAFIRYIEEGRGGWVGFHHAALLGEFDGYPMWNWFSDFLGGVRYVNYIAPLADGTVTVEDKNHPIMQGVQPSFVIQDDEWYIFDKSPRANVQVLASVDEASYNPPSDIKMGDHPVVWVNPDVKARNVYFLMGHDKKLYENQDFLKMFRNAIIWASGI